MNKQEQKQQLKTIEEVVEEYSKSGSWQCPVSFIDGANYQKQIDENLALEFGNFLLKEIWTNKLAGKKLDECFQIFQSERNK